MKLIWPYFKKNRYRIFLGIVCMIVVDATQLVIPRIIQQAIDTLNFETLNTGTLALQCLFILGLGLLMALLRYGWRNLLMGSARDVEKGIRDSLFAHILELDMDYFDRIKTGDIMAHATSDINHIRMAFGFGLIVLVDTILLGGATLLIMFWMHPKLTLIAMIPMPFLIVVTRVLGKKMHLFHKTAQESFSQLTELVRESFFGIRIIKVFNFESLTGGKVADASKDYFRKNLKRAVVMALLRPLLAFFFNMSTLIIIIYGGTLTMQKAITPGELVAFLQYLGILAWPIIAIGWMTNLFQRGMASLGRINTLLDAKPSVDAPPAAQKPKKINGHICFENVFFTYQDGKNILSDIHLAIKPGEKIGIIGPPGSGKTSLVQLIPRLYDPDRGTIWVDDMPVTQMDLEHLRKSVAFMPQESFLFSGTIRENILMGLDMSSEKLDQLIKTCCLDTTLQKIPQGIDAVVGERGITLSGGQKQRIALARTLARPAKVLVFDDPISQIDTHTAARIITQLNQLNIDATMIIISHRISALAACDRIYIIKDGRISHQGRHEELIKADAFYRNSYLVQQFEETHAS